MHGTLFRQASQNSAKEDTTILLEKAQERHTDETSNSIPPLTISTDS
jgi:hypothetical protein